MSRFTSAVYIPRPLHEIGPSGKRITLERNDKAANEEPPPIRFYYHECNWGAHFPGILSSFSQKDPQKGGQTAILSTVELYNGLRGKMAASLDTLTSKGTIGRNNTLQKIPAP
ncbi:hypothetical protein BDW68DRAFT_73515 [Aspergillus falconensis]